MNHSRSPNHSATYWIRLVVLCFSIGLSQNSRAEKKPSIQLDLGGVMQNQMTLDSGLPARPLSAAQLWVFTKIPTLSLGNTTGLSPADLYRLAREVSHQKMDHALDTLQRILIQKDQLPPQTRVELTMVQAYLTQELGLPSIAGKAAVTALREDSYLSPEGRLMGAEILLSLPLDLRVELIQGLPSTTPLDRRLEPVRTYALARESKRPYQPSDKEFVQRLPELGILLGLNAFEAQKYQDALNGFQLVRLNEQTSPQLRETAIHLIGRTLYEAGYMAESASVLLSLQPTSPEWALAQEEGAWALLQVGDYEKALGVSRTFSTEFFNHRFLPGFSVIRAATHLKRCELMSGAQEIQSFKRTYLPFAKWYEEQGRQLNQDQILSLIRKEGGVLSNPQLKNRLRGELSVNRTLDRYQAIQGMLNQELAQLDIHYAQSPRLPLPSVGFRQYFKDFRLDVEKDVSTFRQLEAREIQQSIQFLYSDLLISGEIMLLLDFELMEQVRKVSRKDVLATGPGDIEKLRLSSKEERWPFEAEAWIDELGRYKDSKVQLCGTVIRK